MNAKATGEKAKKAPRILLFTIILLTVLAAAAVWTYITIQKSETEKEQQRMIREAAEKNESEDHRISQLRDACLAEAEQRYYKYLEANGVKMKRKDGSISYRLPQNKIEVAFTERKEAEGLCFKKYP
jgi:uncharacterized protein HemX